MVELSPHVVPPHGLVQVYDESSEDYLKPVPDTGDLSEKEAVFMTLDRPAASERPRVQGIRKIAVNVVTSDPGPGDLLHPPGGDRTYPKPITSRLSDQPAPSVPAGVKRIILPGPPAQDIHASSRGQDLKKQVCTMIRNTA